MRSEYKSVKCKKSNFFSGSVDIELIDDKVNGMAREGWELISMCPYFCWGAPQGIILMFKRTR